MPMHFIHRFDRPHMRLADSPQGEAGSGGGQPGPEAGIDPDNTRILAQFETQGTATAASSIYAVRYGSSEGDQAVTGLTNEGVNVQDLGRLQDTRLPHPHRVLRRAGRFRLQGRRTPEWGHQW